MLRALAGLSLFLTVFLAGCASSSAPSTSREGVQQFVEFREAAFEEKPGFVLTRPPKEDTRVYVSPDVVLNERDIVSTVLVPIGERYGVGVEFTRSGKRRLRKFTEENRTGYVALVIDGEVQLVLPILQPITEGRMMLASNFDRDQATELLQQIKARIP